jgi:hypothetical protein
LASKWWLDRNSKSQREIEIWATSSGDVRVCEFVKSPH